MKLVNTTFSVFQVNKNKENLQLAMKFLSKPQIFLKKKISRMRPNFQIFRRDLFSRMTTFQIFRGDLFSRMTPKSAKSAKFNPRENLSH